MLELIITSPKPGEKLPEIKFNYEEIKEVISKQVEYYKDIVVTKEEIAGAKATLADLRKFKDNFEVKRKAAKKQYLEPYETFEKRYKEIIAVIDEPITAIDKQIKEFEAKEKEEKKENIKKYYEEKAADIVKLQPFEKIFNERWLNSTYKNANITKEIKSAIQKFNADMETIKGLNTKFENQVIDKYLQTLDLPLALQENVRFEKQEANLKAAEEAKKKEEEARTIEEKKLQSLNKLYGNPDKKKEEETPEPVPQEETPATPTNAEKILSCNLRISGTAEQLKKLKAFMAENKISYAVIKNMKKKGVEKNGK